MGSSLELLMLAGLVQAGSVSDTITYADQSTRDLVALARARHTAADTSVRDYRASLRYRMSFAMGKRRWAQLPTAAVAEQDAVVHWSLPNDLRVDVRGRRDATRLEGVDIAASFSRPWFVPRTLSDSIRIMGSESNRAAPHPLAANGPATYQYAAGSALTMSIGQRSLTIRPITITPRPGAAAAVVGRLWVETSTGDVVRFTFRFVGTELWTDPDAETRQDSSESRFANRLVSRILQLDADLEYSLQDNQFWLPYRQVLSGRITLPFGFDLTVPFEATTVFDDYEVNTGRAVAFDAAFADSTRVRDRASRRDSAATAGTRELENVVVDSTLRRDATGYLSRGGRYQIHRPPLDSLAAYTGWTDSLEFEGTDADRARLREALSDVATMAENIDPELTGRAGAGFAWEKISEIVRYNRVQGTTLSVTGRSRGPFAFTDLYGTARFGFADNRLMATGTMVRDAPSGRLTLTAGRDLVDIDAFARGLNFGNSLRGMLVGRDDGAYLLAHGVRIALTSSLGLATEFEWGLRAEHHQSARAEARAGFPRVFGDDGFFPANAVVREGWATGGHLRLDRVGYGGGLTLMGEGLLVDGEAAGRFTLQARKDFGALVTTRVKLGFAPGADRVPQLALNAGGVQTVRGFDFGVATGDALWSAQVDVALGGKALKWLVFADAGQAGRLSNFEDARFLSGGGVAASLLGGIIRAELSHPITERNGRGLRFDLIFGSPK